MEVSIKISSLLIIALAGVVSVRVYGQSPQKMSYQQ